MQDGAGSEFRVSLGFSVEGVWFCDVLGFFWVYALASSMDLWFCIVWF